MGFGLLDQFPLLGRRLGPTRLFKPGRWGQEKWGQKLRCSNCFLVARLNYCNNYCVVRLNYCSKLLLVKKAHPLHKLLNYCVCEANYCKTTRTIADQLLQAKNRPHFS